MGREIAVDDGRQIAAFCLEMVEKKLEEERQSYCWFTTDSGPGIMQGCTGMDRKATVQEMDITIM